MSQGVEEVRVDCPYCGEAITVLADSSVGDQHYTEDCEVCCQPMVVLLKLDAWGRCQVAARREDDA